MDVDGIDVAILTPTVGLKLLAIDGVAADHAVALCRAYNDYAVADDIGHRYEGHPRTEVVRMAVRLPFYSQTALAELILAPAEPARLG